MSFLGSPRRASLGELIFDSHQAGERRKKICVWRFDAYDPYGRRRVGPFNHPDMRRWASLLPQEPIEQFDPEVDFEEWESKPYVLADMADAGKILFGVMNKKDLEVFIPKAAMQKLVKDHHFYARKIAAARVWLAKSGKQVAFEPVIDASGNEVTCR